METLSITYKSNNMKLMLLSSIYFGDYVESEYLSEQ